MLSQEVLSGIESLARSHDSLRHWLGGLAAVDPMSPSRLPGWTVGHVMTHIARDGDSMLEVLAGRLQYAGGSAGRNAAIEEGAGRPWEVLVEDVAESSRRVDDAFAGRDDWSGTAPSAVGDHPLALLPQRRQREVEIHRVDLGLGYEVDDLPAEFVRRDLRVLEMMWNARRPMGLTGLPPAALAEPPARRLGWLMGRVEIDGVEPAGVY